MVLEILKKSVWTYIVLLPLHPPPRAKNYNKTRANFTLPNYYKMLIITEETFSSLISQLSGIYNLLLCKFGLENVYP